MQQKRCIVCTGCSVVFTQSTGWLWHDRTNPFHREICRDCISYGNAHTITYLNYNSHRTQAAASNARTNNDQHPNTCCLTDNTRSRRYVW